jgi:hypothetical protein
MNIAIDLGLILFLAPDGDGEGVAEGSTPDAVPRSDRPAR